jgi:hypothetical protein
VVAIACENQHCRDDMVREHLPMVFSPFLNVDHQDLLEPKCVLCQNVPFLQASNLTIGPIAPELLEIEPVFRCD